MGIKRLLYFAYYVKRLDWKLFRRFLRHAREHTGRSCPRIVCDALISSFRYNISILEYFQFRFFDLDDDNRKTYAGTGYMYEYQLAMNPKSERSVLDNKLMFYEVYRPLIRRMVVSLDDLRHDRSLKGRLQRAGEGKVVLKYSRGKCGKQVKILEDKAIEEMDLAKYMANHGSDLAEEYVIQHPDLMALSPSGVNTVRIITQLTSGNGVDLLGVRLRVTVNSAVDNMAAGNFAATVDPISGVVDGPGVYSDITRADVSVHPVTGVRVQGFKIPFWAETLSLAKQAALMSTGNRSVGWDIAITQSGPELIEGNHDWCKLLWQMPAKRGMKKTLDRYLAELKSNRRVEVVR